MPSIDVAMARSLRGGVWEILSDSLARGIAAGMSKRDIVDDTTNKVNDFKTAISSWDNCMAANFCKWPVIAIIVVGGLILLGIITCIVRCACCGVACCCSCCQCLKCCGNCCGCCDPPGGPKQKYLDAPYNPEQGYKTQAPMHAPFPPVAANHPAPAAAAPPQYAEFDMPRKGGEDALPAMPSWEESSNKKVLVHEEEVELNQLKKPSTDPTVPLMAGSSSSIPTSPMPMEHPTAYGQAQANGPRGYVSQTQPTIPFTDVNGPGSGYSSNSGLAYPQDQPYDAVPPIGGVGAIRSQSPAQSYRGYGQEPMNQSYNQLPAPGNGYGNQGLYGPGSRGASPDGYGMQRRGTGDRHSPMGGGPAPYGASPRGSPAPQNGRGYGAPAYNAPRDNFNRAYSPAPDRQYGTPSPRPMNNTRPAPERSYGQSPPHSPITNNSGFDFTSGFARPQEYDRRPSESREPAGQEGYPGYKPYNRPQDGWSGV